jgi:Uncharacterised nucleotidyltransferase
MSVKGGTLDADAVLAAILAARGADDRGAADEGGILPDPDAGLVLCPDLVEAAEYHGVAPLIEPVVGRLVRRSPAAAAENVRRMLLALAVRHRRTAVVREACIDELLTAFAAAGIRVILLKGAALAHLIYPRPELRPMVDIDVLIAPGQTAHATEVISALGYSLASQHSSRLGAKMHHLPVARLSRSGCEITLEIHHDAMSPNQPCRLTLASLASDPQIVRRAGGDGLTLGHLDMLRHLARHAFEPARRIRLIHLYDLWRYPERFAADIDWQRLAAEFPDVVVILRLVAYVFGPYGLDAAPADHPLAAVPAPGPAGVGKGMIPLSEIAESPMTPLAKLAAMLNPPAWWLHGFYGVPPEERLLITRAVRHPAMLLRWMVQRLSGPACESGSPLPQLWRW